MEIAVKNLVKRGNTYYFRSRLPDYSGEIKISLKTSDLKKAVNACKLATERLNSILSRNWQMIPLQEIRRMIADSLIRENLEDREMLLASYGRLCEHSRLDGANDMLKLAQFIERALLENDLSAMNATLSANSLLQGIEHRLNLVFDTAPYRQMIFRTFSGGCQKRKTAPFLTDKQNQKVWIKVVKTE